MIRRRLYTYLATTAKNRRPKTTGCVMRALHDGTVNKIRTVLTSISILALASCSTFQDAPALAETPKKVIKKPKAPIYVDDKRLTQESLYSLLVAEMAIERREFDVALNNYSQQAFVTQDVEVAARAAKVAFSLDNYPKARELSALWYKLAPFDTDAKRMLTQVHVQLDELESAFAHARELLEQGERVDFESIATRVPASNAALRQKLLASFTELLGYYPNNTSLMVGLSLIHEQSKNYDVALTFASRAFELEPANIRAVYQQSRLLQLLERNAEALDSMSKLVALTPHNTIIRLRYAGMLARNRNLKEAHEQYSILVSQQPNNPEILLSLAVIENEQEMYDSAASHFQQLIDRNQMTSVSHYNLAKIAMARGQKDIALEHYLAVEPGQQFLSAVYRASELMNAEQGAPAALSYVSQLLKTAPEKYRDSLYLRQANMLAFAKRYDEARTSFDKALSLSPDNTAILYSRAMMLLGTDNFPEAESDFKRIIALRPNHASALNAYGYTLVDLTDRVDEAYELILRAYEIEPNNPMIIDSLGWAEFKRGNIDEAVTLLSKALAKLDDPEVSAHLSEALWAKGEKKKAMALISEAIKKSPENSLLLRTLERFNAYKLSQTP